MTLTTLMRTPWARRMGWAGCGLLVVWVLAWAAVPPLLKGQIEEKGSAALGRKLTVGAVDFRPWSLELTLKDVAIAKADGSGAQFAVARIHVDAEMQSLLRMAPVLDAIDVDAPTLQLTHLGGGHYDIDDILERLRTPPDAPPSAPLRFAFYNIVLQDGAVDFTDQVGKSVRQHTVRGLHLALPFLSNLESKRDVQVTPRLAFQLNGSHFDTAAEGTPFAQTRKGDATFKVQHLDLAPYLPYLPASLPVQLRAAVLDIDLGLDFAQAQQAHVQLHGTVKVSDLQLADRAGGELLSVASIATALADVRPLEGVVQLASLEINAPVLKLARNRAGRLNLDFFASKAAEGATKTGAAGASATPAAAPFRFQMEHFALHQGEVRWNDDSTQPQARMALAEIELQAKALQWPMQAPAQWEGSLMAPWRNAPARLAFQGEGTDQAGKLHATLNDVALGLAAPYAAQWLTVGMNGVLEAELEATWKEGALQVSAPRLAVRDFALQGTVKDKATTVAERAAQEMPHFKLLEILDARADLAGRKAQVGKVALRQASAMLSRDAQGQWMFERWRKASTTPAAEAAPAAPGATPWKATLAELLVDDATLALDDRSLGRPVRLEVSKLQLGMKNVALDGKRPAPLTVSARVKSGRTEPGTLRYKGTLAWDPLAVQGAVEALDLPAHAVMPYVADRLNIDVLRADASFKGDVRYTALPAGPQVRVRGNAALEDFRANSVAAPDGADGIAVSEELLSWKSLNVPGIDLAMAPGAATRVQVREAALTDFYARLLVSPQGRLNLQDLVKPEPAAPTNLAVASPAPAASAPITPVAEVGPPAIVQVGAISLVNGKVLFSDHFIQPNYSADLSELTGKLGQFSSQPTGGVVQLADLDLRGRAEGTATLEITGKVNPLAKPLALDIHGRVRDLELPPLSPYAIKYAGYGINRGKLSVDVQYTVQPDGQLTASNNIVLNQLSFGDKVEGAPNSLPVKLAVALLADRNGVIDLNLPISGSLNDPQFSIGPVVWKIIGNLIVKAVTAPFALLSHALGGGGEELSAVDFAPGSSVLSEKARQGLDKVAQALKDRSSLTVTVEGTASLETERDALKRERLRAQLLAEKRRRAVVSGQDASAVTAVSEAESPELLRAVYRRADITKPRNLVGLTKDLPPPEMEALLLASITVNEDAMRELALQRGVAVKDYLASRELSPERLFLGSAKTEPAAADWKPHAQLNLTQR